MTHTDRPAPPAYTPDVLPRVGPRLLPRGATRCPDCRGPLSAYGDTRLCPGPPKPGCGRAFGVEIGAPPPAPEA